MFTHTYEISLTGGDCVTILASKGNQSADDVAKELASRLRGDVSIYGPQEDGTPIVIPLRAILSIEVNALPPAELQADPADAGHSIGETFGAPTTPPPAMAVPSTVVDSRIM